MYNLHPETYLIKLFGFLIFPTGCQFRAQLTPHGGVRIKASVCCLVQSPVLFPSKFRKLERHPSLMSNAFHYLNVSSTNSIAFAISVDDLMVFSHFT